MSGPGQAFEALAAALRKLPGIGPKAAERLAYFLVRAPRDTVDGLTRALAAARSRVRTCRACFNLTEDDPCVICTDSRRDRNVICVVEQASQIAAVERTREFHGLYHVLQGVLSPLDGVGPDDLKVKELLARVREGGGREVIIAVNPKTEGEHTAAYLAQLLHPLGVKVTRIASGVPLGADLEYTDELTLARALDGRREL